MNKVSYALGLGIGRQLQDLCGEDLNLEDFAQAVKDKATEIPAYAIDENKNITPFTLKLGEMTDDERDIILKGCLINYNRI